MKNKALVKKVEGEILKPEDKSVSHLFGSKPLTVVIDKRKVNLRKVDDRNIRLTKIDNRYYNDNRVYNNVVNTPEVKEKEVDGFLDFIEKMIMIPIKLIELLFQIFTLSSKNEYGVKLRRKKKRNIDGWKPRVVNTSKMK